jgi:hypothetical protein
MISKYLTRDSALLWLAMAAAALTYLAAMPPPTEWTYAQWMQTLATGAFGAAGKLMSSPLAHSKDAQ